MKTVILAFERVEGIWAVLETDTGDSFLFPAELLPETVREGTYMRFTIEADPDATRAAQQRVRKTRQALRNPRR